MATAFARAPSSERARLFTPVLFGALGALSVLVWLLLSSPASSGPWAGLLLGGGSRLPPPSAPQQLHAAAHACPAEGAAAAGAPGSAPAALLSDGDEDAAVQETFERVYRERKWGDDGGGSGAGSTVSVTRYARLILELVVHKYLLHSIVDAPCGAMVWMPVLLAKLRASVPCLHYTGVDIVRPVVAANVARFAGEPWMSFAVADFTVEDLPAPPRSVIFCRDALQHLSMPQIFAALHHMASSLRGDAGRFLLLREPPFNLEPTEELFEVEAERGRPKILLLYSGAQLARIDWVRMTANATAMQLLTAEEAANVMAAVGAAAGASGGLRRLRQP